MWSLYIVYPTQEDASHDHDEDGYSRWSEQKVNFYEAQKTETKQKLAWLWKITFSKGRLPFTGPVQG